LAIFIAGDCRHNQGFLVACGWVVGSAAVQLSGFAMPFLNAGVCKLAVSCYEIDIGVGYCTLGAAAVGLMNVQALGYAGVACGIAVDRQLPVLLQPSQMPSPVCT
jgi:hypothetical protein